ncbi:protocadherin gamma-A5-like isoform X6 [Megalops cyprinoides]|uniref:protocadherin gamma-A5-like isoform X6 n=1 Tax=Megalops cyprinoides TaxID=118141 RepID=UPI0018645051|nr:protocadherin gamma-A5-like isoform X6 [Megalops cyprinoides]
MWNQRRLGVKTASQMKCPSLGWQVRFSILLLFLINAICGQIRYSIPEEMKKGLFVGDVAKDLGLEVKRLFSGRARLVFDGKKQYVDLNKDKGQLVVKERIDREELCAQQSPCSFSLEMVLEDPLELYVVTIEVQDINDNAPAFSEKEIRLDISESALVGARFLLDTAVDPDVGLNGLQSYALKPTSNFVLKQHSRPDGSKYAEMVLQTPLDREKEGDLSLTLTAVDGGNPQMSGTVKIFVTVLDANDNAPVFTEELYKASLFENAVEGTLVSTVKAVDIDIGFNGNITYVFTHADESIRQKFQLNSKTGEVRVIGKTDHELVKHYEINIQARDTWGLTGSCKLIIEILDLNDNSPVITITSFSGKISEDSMPGTVLGLISVQDLDSGKNGQVHLSIDESLPFKIKTSLRNYYTLVTDGVLDREKVSKYNITIVAVDMGIPSLSTEKTVLLEISDINDNAPAFQQNSYSSWVTENNPTGLSVLSVRATDPDWGQNARISYYLIDSDINGTPVSEYFSVNSDNGIIQSVRSIDYEQIKEFKMYIKAQDGGSPPLTSNVTVKIRIQDQNDNAPQILYPVQTGVSQVAEMVPRSADVGYLVTKVVAVDVDSGQNAWLSYKLLKATDRALFEVGLQNGEIRTLRQVTDKDAVKQRLTVVVEDNGQPSRSATVNVNVAVADSFPEVLSEFTEFTHDKDYNDDLTFYLVLALAAVSFLFISCLVVIISVKVYRWRQSRIFYQSNLPVIPYYPPCYADAGGTGTLQHMYNYEVCMTTDSRKSDNKYLRPISQSLLSVDVSGTETMEKQEKQACVDSTATTLQKPPNADWRFPQNQRPGTSGQSRYQSTQERWTPYGKSRAGPRPEEAGAGAGAGTGPWPNPPSEAEQLQALMAAANEVSEATATLGPGTMGLSTRYSPQFTLQHVPDYRQNVYIPGSTATLTAGQQQPPQPALPQPPPQAEAPKAAQTPASKKKSAKKDKK